MPIWVKVAGIITAVIVVLFVVLLLFGGEHGPARHRASGQTVAAQ